MYEFKIELAETSVEVVALCESTQALCTDYFTDKPAKLRIVMNEDDIEKERTFATSKSPSRQDLEFMALYRKICSELAKKDIVLMHGSSISVDGQGYVFCAPSGTGKSTHTRLWRQYLGDRAVMINDDKPLLRICNDSVRIYGTPWNGKHRLGNNMSAPLKSICFLNRSFSNAIKKVDNKDCFPLLLEYIFRPEDPALLIDVLNTITKITYLCDFWSLECNMDLNAAEVSFSAMSA